MKYAITKTLIVLLFLISPVVRSQPQTNEGTVAFDCPNVPSPEFQFDLNRRVIALVIEDPTADIAPLFNTINNLHLRNYRSRSVDLKEVVQYYEKTLKGRGWNVLGEHWQGDVGSDNLHLYTLQSGETIDGIFVIVNSDSGVYLINIVGEIPQKQLGELLRNLNQLGIEIPELMALRPRDLKLAPPPVLPEPESIELDPKLPDINENKSEVKKTPVLQEAPKPTKSWNWQIDGKPIHELQIQNGLATPEGLDPKRIGDTIAAERANIMKILGNGSGDITKVMPVLANVLLSSDRKVSLRIEEKDAKRTAIIIVDNLPKTISVLESLKISGPRGNQIHRSIGDKTVPEKLDMQTLLVATRFWAGEAPIHEVRVRGNKKIPEEKIQRTLENGSEDIEQALKTLFKVMPHFEEINLQVNEEDSKYIATITVDEKPLATDVYLGLNPPLRFGFNRVTGWEIGTGFEVGKRKEIGPLWAWSVGDSISGQTSKFFGKVSYAFGNPHLHYRVGGTANWGKPYSWNLGGTAQVHRLTEVVAPELFPGHNRGVTIFQRTIGMPDFQNYYLRQGAEMALQWAPVMSIHSFKLAAVAESHANLQKSTDWFVTNWKSSLELRENPPITPGQMRSLTFQYDFDKRTNSLGWHSTLLVEHSSAAAGSDFDFTRLLLHLRYAFPLAENRIRTRFLFGFSDASLPIQRQFVIGGMGGLRGYPWLRHTEESAGIIDYKSGHRSSPYAFAGDRGFLLNVEYHYRLANLSSWNIFRNAFAIAFLDEGQVWNVSGPAYTFDPKGNIGIGLQFGENDFIVRVNIAKAFESSQGTQITTTWYYSF